jgi:cystathionine beta-lyase
MPYDFDQLIERRNTNSAKWRTYPEDVIPMWVADMDFASPEPVIRALRERVEHGVFGYELPSAELANAICERIDRRYKWPITPEHLVFLPGLVTGANVVCRAIGQPGDGVLMQTPAYPPFLSAPQNHGLTANFAELTSTRNGRTLRYEIDFEAFEAAITPRTHLFLLCNPQNPAGCVYDREQLTRLADICLRHDIVICSDEIHCDLLLGDTRHTPLASIAPEIAERCITLMAPSKTFNLPGLGCSFAIVTNPDLRQRLNTASAGIVPLLNVMGLAAALAAYREGDEWLAELRHYLTANRDALVNYVAECLPGVYTTAPEATYLAWLDCREAGIEGPPFEFFLSKAKVALGDGAIFGPGGQGFVRLTFGCPRSRLMQALEQMREALHPPARATGDAL